MKSVITEGILVNGDGVSVLEGATLVIREGKVDRVYEGPARQEDLDTAEEVVAASGMAVIPGVINHHAHRVTMAPAGAYGAPPPPFEQVLKNVTRHLLQGTTTVLSVDGFGSPNDVEATNRVHPLNIRGATIAYPSAFESAKLADGKGLTEQHYALTAENVLHAGAPAVGECGAGGTLGGGSQDWLYIPKAVKTRTGKDIEPKQARALKEAVLGRYIDRAAYDERALVRALQNTGLENDLRVPEAKKLVEDSVLPQFDTALQSLLDGVRVAKVAGVPVILHNAAASKTVVRAASEEYRIIAGHSNHPSFELGEAVDFARFLKRRGSLIDIATLDMFGAKRLCDSPDIFFAMLDEGLADLISTDYAGGFHDSILLGVQRAVEAGVTTLARAIRMATFNVTIAVPKLAPDRGLLAPGMIADIVLAQCPAVSEVDTVIVGGKVVVRRGELVTPVQAA